MIDIAFIERALLAKLDGLEVGHCVEIRTYKRNRSVMFTRTSESGFEIREDGYRVETIRAPRSKVKKILKVLLKREFPRSRKVRLYDLGEYDPDLHQSMGRKKL